MAAALVAVAAVLCPAFPPGAAAASGRLLASGCSVSNTGYLNELAADYEKASGVKMFVRGGGSVIGLEDIVGGSADIAASCAGPRPGGPAGLEYVQVAWDALVFIVHPSTPLASISFSQATAVFQGGIADWSRLGAPAGPITVFLQRPTRGLSGVEGSIREQVLGGRAPAVGPNVSRLSSTGIVEQLVEKTPGSFAASGFSSARKRKVTMLALDGVRPTREAILDRSYPLRRPLYLIVRTPVRPEVKAFLDFALGRRGQELIGSYGAIPLREMR